MNYGFYSMAIFNFESLHYKCKTGEDFIAPIILALLQKGKWLKKQVSLWSTLLHLSAQGHKIFGHLNEVAWRK